MDLAPTAPHAAPTAASERLAPMQSAFVVTVLGWLLPGLGQLYVGRPGKALLMFLAIGGLFYAGLHLTAFTCVNPETYGLEFIAHAFLGGPTAAATYLSRDVALIEPMPFFEIGRLYAAVAGLLNIVAVCDAVGDVLAHNQQVEAQRELRERYRAQQAEREVLAAAEAREAAREEAATWDASAQEGVPDDESPGIGMPEADYGGGPA